jgi:hypothetical protein
MRHHLVILHTSGDVTRPPHDARNPPAALKWRTLLAAERRRPGVGISIEPRAVVSREKHNRGNIYGAAVGGYVLALLEVMIVALVPQGSQYKDVLVFLILILVLVFRPSGIFSRAPRKVG